MAKINIKESGLGIRGARMIVGMRGHRPSGFNQCVSGKLKGIDYPDVPKGMGGKNNPCVHFALAKAAQLCGAHVNEKKLGELAERCSKLVGFSPEQLLRAKM